jgi:hypothetical protein
MEEGTTVQNRESTIVFAAAGANLRNRTDAADHGDAVAHRTTVSVERRTQAVVRGFDFREVLQAHPE